ncbi:flagellar motor protein MotB [Clostridium manihotivorum]|uniref:Chemotaxis protein MotB n=1 Tax=Clostridium manihotivorum TaxID=2320868 RepID=A0A3R5VBC2_9CLOT|nr:flagellar motor protein MotB [Clostridium manihotivorum]QAA34467.1 chemotaxis protein MotB [Clostridium manihotivorum]
MKKKKEHHEEHVDETWLIPYADMLTLLLALFIVMFAMSKVDQQKLQRLSAEFSVIFSGGSSVMAEGGTSSTAVVQSEAANAGTATEKSNTEKEEDAMNEVKKNLESEIQSKGYSDKVKIELNKEGLEISIQDAVLFNSGDAQVLKTVNPLLVEISNMIKGLDNEIKVVGHTDNVPITTSKFRSNWDLSAMRAINVMNFMVGSGGVNTDKISIQAYGEHRPKYSNDTAEGRAKNRRVEIFIIRKYTQQTQTTTNNQTKTNSTTTNQTETTTSHE